MLVEHLERLLPVYVLAREFVRELEEGNEFGAVQPPIPDRGGIVVHVFRVPPAPERRLAVGIDQVIVMPEDV